MGQNLRLPDTGGEGPEPIRPALIYREHGGMIELAAWSPVSTMVASCGLDASVRVWDTASGKTALVYRGHRDLVRDIAFSPDGAYLATCDEDGQVQVWEAVTGTPERLYQGHRRTPISLCWSPDGTQIASADETTIHLWPVWEGLPGAKAPLTLGRAHECIFSAVCWTREGNRLLTVSEQCVHQWEATTGRLLCLWDFVDPVVAIALAPEGTRLAIAKDDATVQVICARTDSVLLSFRVMLDAAWGLSWSPCGRYLAACGYDAVEVWDAHSGVRLCRYQGYGNDSCKIGPFAEPEMTCLSNYDTTVTSLVITFNRQKWYTFTGTQSSIFVV
jgi:WD40 repeat protein